MPLGPLSLSQWIERLDHFDFWTSYSDDYRVYSRGREALFRLRSDLLSACLSDAEKAEIVAGVGEFRRDIVAGLLGVPELVEAGE